VAGAVGSAIVLLFGGGYVIGGLANSDQPTVQPTPSPRAEERRLPEIAFGCRVAPPEGSTFTTITIAAQCQREVDRLLRRNDGINVVLLEPRSGVILALVSDGIRVPTLERALT